MIVRAKSGELIIDPDGLYLKPGKDQPNFRVISTQRLKANGVRVVGCFKGTNEDVIQDRTTKHTINLAEDGHEGKWLNPRQKRLISPIIRVPTKYGH